ncbi:Phage shock protein PspC (stress-responsive transcriptional regulator) [Cyclobacterium xiamenense]|uniref:Phage shock protein PspC (Stress-responsive transcriptional regulator) n=1 Tax=Cyclobacterium xiamenense TaxID=1297121 RepID=A0A1H6YEQ7_9BACT|nr:PspC domain-containing protein [Cyclobacterium xiamenense]SEJ39758.1 Phage shock protein PspC (stress-responsive transcriptional regulator) [Cyclobacterium xiamenense]
MKKTISINISGILFHIEEDGYTSLKNYLDAINQHFSLYADNQEIITDIENRIAEIFLSNLKNNKQVITAENVSNLIEKMGTIADFKASALDLDGEKAGEEENDFYKYITPPDQKSGKAYKKLTRLANTKILGGVCAGFANYFSIDPLWTRLITILLVFSGGLSFRSFPIPFFSDDFGLSVALGWWTLIAYILLWIILPVSHEKPEDKNIKKLYRNPDDRVLGGVGSGLAAYFNLDVIWMRLAFVGLIFAGGSGFVLYLILWIITPVAKSITERIEMKGGAITLSNIETTIKQNLSSESAREESTAKKLVLAPFRFLGLVINGIGKALGPFGRFLVELIRVVFGLLIFFVGMLVLILPLAFLGIYTDILTNEGWAYVLDGFPIDSLAELLPIWLAITVSILVLIPSIVLVILGISVLIKRNLIDGRFGLVLFGIWLLSILLVAFQAPKIIGQFNANATHAVEKQLEVPSGTLVVRTEDSLLENKDWGLVRLELRGHAEDKVVLNQTFSSRGSTHEDALKNASSVNYSAQLTDSVLVLGKTLNFPSGVKFRMQQLNQTMYLPYNQPFVMDRSLLPILKNTLARDGYKSRDISNSHHWIFNEDGLLCLNCINDHKQSPADSVSRALFQNRYFME